MSIVVRLLPSKLEFTVQEGQTILEGALFNKVSLEYSCSNGQCGQCKAELLSGVVASRDFSEDVGLSEREILTCSSIPKSDITLNATYFPELLDIERKTIPVKVDQFILVNKDVLMITFRLAPNSKFNFLPGQFVDLNFSGEKRSYSIANADAVNHKIELHIKRVEGGLFSEHLFNDLKQNQLFRIYGPLGTFFLRENDSPLIFMCTGTGFAPVKSMVEHLIDRKTKRQIYIYWGGRLSQDLYSNLPQQWSNGNTNIEFIPVLSREQNDSPELQKLTLTEGKYIQHKIVENHNDLERFDVYACGSEQMIHDAKKLLIKHGLSSEKFYSDAFLPSN